VAANPGRLLRTAVCRSVHPIELRFDRDTSAVVSIDIGGQLYVRDVTDVEAFAKLDGFASALEMGRFFRKLQAPGHSGACSFAGKKTDDLVPPLLMEQPETGCCENHCEGANLNYFNQDPLPFGVLPEAIVPVAAAALNGVPS
jgi:hypothetical protein